MRNHNMQSLYCLRQVPDIQFHLGLDNINPSSAKSIQSEYVNKSTEGTDEASTRLNSTTLTPSVFSKPSPSSPKSHQSKPPFPKPALASS
ncbi:hypothetical protein WN944_019807 [Citrus x changshan-huyou]|uniref:Uncharacterized protein n=1 Tax=Citrus x changshan-huyou TaxID=2935761 RepID=A0AAP0QGQ5_9ROSI